MTSDRILELYEESPSHLWSAVRRENPELYEAVNEREGDTFSERAYQHIHGESERLCDRCGAPCSFNGFGEGFSRYCGRQCAATARSERVNGRTCRGCGAVFCVTTRNEHSAHDICCSDACYDRWAEAFTPAGDAVEDAVEALEGAQNPSLALCAHSPELYWFAALTREGYTESERIHRLLNGEPETCDVCGSEPSFISWGEGFASYCSTRCAARAQGGRRVRRSYREISRGGRAEGYTPAFTASEFEGMHGGPYVFTCDSCGSEVEARLENGQRPVCRSCHPLGEREDTYEGQLHALIEGATDEAVLRNDRTLLGGRELDVYIPDLNLAFEMNGLYWHSEDAGGKGRSYHLSKTRACEERGVHLVHVWGDDWRERRAIVRSRVMHLLGRSERSVGARECEVAEMPARAKNRFMRENHLQSEGRSALKMGLMLEGEAQAVMTLSRPRAALSQTDGWEITRYCTRSGVHVPGGAERLLHHLSREAGADLIISFADRAWTSTLGRSLYDALGFGLSGETAPGYWYTRGYSTRRHRAGFMKHMLADRLNRFDPALTERENMRRAGWDRVWGCGSLRYELSV